MNLVKRVESQGDRRRRYIQLVPETIALLGVIGGRRVGRLIFVCTENAARSQLAAVLWNGRETGVAALSGGTCPAMRVHPGALKAAARRGFELRGARPGPIPETRATDLVITVCDKAHELLTARGAPSHVHWSVSDPIVSGRSAAFELTLEVLDRRIDNLSAHVTAI
jgi:ArsR family transcriptional regulator, arsenate/arsenite/antimonite-responsive transcriptional repressor / arsenate reductase (thioredoxin)